VSTEQPDSSLSLVVLAEDFYPNVSGGAHARFRFCELAAERGHDVTVYTPRRDETPVREVVEDIKIVRPFRAKPSNVPAFATLARITRTLYSVALFWYLLWHLHGQEIDGFHSASHSMHWVGKFLSLLYRRPLVTFIGYTPSANKPWQLHPKFLRERLNFRLFMGSVVFCRSQRVAKIVRDASGADVSVLHGILNTDRLQSAAAGFDQTDIRDRFDLDTDDRFLLFVGRLVPIKNPMAAVDVLAALSEEYTLVMIGDGPQASTVKAYADDLEVDGRVRFAGQLPHEETLQCIAAADTLLLPSNTEAYPTAVFEALALRSHVVATPVGVLPEIDHPRLSLGTVDELPALVTDSNRGADGEGAGDVDEVTLDQYSMERYTERMLGAFTSLRAGPDSVVMGSDSMTTGRT